MCPENWEIQSQLCPHRELPTERSPVLPAAAEPARLVGGGEEEDEEGGGQALGEGEGRLQLLIMIFIICLILNTTVNVSQSQAYYSSL